MEYIEKFSKFCSSLALYGIRAVTLRSILLPSSSSVSLFFFIFIRQSSMGSTPESTEATSTNITISGNNGGGIKDSSHPYFLHHFDSPGMNLVNTSFDGRSYGAKDPWDDLEDIFGQSNGAKIYHLQKELSDLIQGSSDIAGYFTKIKRLWDELNTMNTHVKCLWDCSCGGKVKMAKSLQDERLIKFLMGLNDTYASVKSSILMLLPLPTLGHAYSLLMQNEKQRENHKGQKFGNSYFKGKKNNLPRKFQGPVKTNATYSLSEIKEQNAIETVDVNNQLIHEHVSQLVQLLQQVKGGQPVCSNSDVSANVANCAGIAPKTFSKNSHFKLTSWILDSGASKHMSSDPSIFSTIRPLPRPLMVNLPNFCRIKVTHIGDVSIAHNLTLHNALYVPVFEYNLLSVHKIYKQYNYLLIFSAYGYMIHVPSVRIPQGLGDAKGGIYFLGFSSHMSRKSSEQSGVSLPKARLSNHAGYFSVSFPVKVNSNVRLWHLRLGYMPFSAMKNISIQSISSSVSNINYPCSIFPLARQTRLSTKNFFELIHIDTWGPYKITTYYGYMHFFTIVDDYSRGTWTFLLSTKNNAFSVLKNFLFMVERQFNTKVKVIRLDNALELGTSSTACDLFLSQGIIHQTLCVAYPQQNRIVERKHRHLLETSRALLHQSNLSISYRGEYLLTATFLINRFPSKIIQNKTPYEILFGKVPNYDFLKSFGCLYYASTLSHNRDKLGPRAIACIFISYPYGKKGYKLLDINLRKVFVSRDKLGDSISILAFYVDDILLIGNNEGDLAQLKSSLHHEFQIKDLGELHYLLGLETLRETQGLIISQRKFTLEVLDEFDCVHLPSVLSPLDPSCKLNSESGELLSDPLCIVGFLDS
ncbi:uncharacterized protein LOC142168857 [Nicotiana tabacum]|uniref:Uncharacterized protein LOC142168857 n=1 Tax=Nicotiana tabacum TaxID=4097 RepID=A0AC58SMC2_TOBAC